MHSSDKTIRGPKSDPLVGKVINNYRLIERLGSGGMGLVYRAEQVSIKRPVAVKLLPTRLSSDEVNVKRVQREATAMGNLRHPNIATLYEFGFSEDDQPYLVMELISGTTLRELLQKEGALPPKRACAILAQVADAMEYAHKHGIIHRDLKPDNVMLDCEHKEDFVKILDFGIAKSSADIVSLTQAGQVVGSPLYMSPEQCMGLMLNGKTDIYSLGIILYESLTGEAPYKGSTSYDTVRKKTSEPPPPFPVPFSQLKELEELTLTCIAPKTTGRPESMAFIKERLEHCGSLEYPDIPRRTTGSATAVGNQAAVSGDQGKNITPSQAHRPASKKQTKLWQDFENTENLDRISGETLVQEGADTADDVRSTSIAAQGGAPDAVAQASGQTTCEAETAQTQPLIPGSRVATQPKNIFQQHRAAILAGSGLLLILAAGTVVSITYFSGIPQTDSPTAKSSSADSVVQPSVRTGTLERSNQPSTSQMDGASMISPSRDKDASAAPDSSPSVHSTIPGVHPAAPKAALRTKGHKSQAAQKGNEAQPGKPGAAGPERRKPVRRLLKEATRAEGAIKRFFRRARF